MSDPYRTDNPQVECTYISFVSEEDETSEGARRFVRRVCRGIEEKSKEGWRPFSVEWRHHNAQTFGWSYCLVMLQRNT